MKTVRSKSLFSVIVITIGIFFLPSIVVGQNSYSVTTFGGTCWSGGACANTSSGPPLPISSQYLFESYGDWYGEITSSYILFSSSNSSGWNSGSGDLRGASYVDFSETFIATSPTFEYYYDYWLLRSGIISASAVYYSLSVVDKTDSISLFNNSYQEYSTTSGQQKSGVLSIPIPIGHEIAVTISTVSSTMTNQYGLAEASIRSYTNLHPTVVPEPISSLLFVTGGTLLAGRRLLNKNKKT